eukprot:TRINITY_DN75675_c0_g1_i1.p1 TRINITY_DN75675_c0_g1~~TRINITY_DN75675_c0_g1_i1.p1  ORF type:complete len:560 (+),score=77.54 TRINITY_DN75675_c0_g1_i1:58-1680(+)
MEPLFTNVFPEVECCVCLLPTEVCTPCGHLLCEACWGCLRSTLCPICRQEIPKSSAGALPVRLAVGSRGVEGSAASRRTFSLPAVSGGGSSPTNRGRRGGGVNSPVSSRSPGQYDRLFSPLPHRLTKRLTRLSVTSKLPEVLECARHLAETASGAGSAEQRDVVTAWSEERQEGEFDAAIVVARGLVSKLLVDHLGSLRLTEFAAMSQQLSDLVRRGALEAPALPLVLQAVARRALQDAIGERWTPWSDAKPIVAALVSLSGEMVFEPCTTLVSQEVGSRLSEAVRRVQHDQLATSLRRVHEVLQPWPAAARELTVALRTWVPQKLLQLATCWGEAPAVAPLPQMPRQSPPPRGGAHARDIPPIQWVDLLRTASLAGLMERGRLAELCGLLEARLQAEGVRTVHAQALNLTSEPGENDGSMPVYARRMATELDQDAAGVRYMGLQRYIVFGFPGGDMYSQVSLPGAGTDAIDRVNGYVAEGLVKGYAAEGAPAGMPPRFPEGRPASSVATSSASAKEGSRAGSSSTRRRGCRAVSAVRAL